MKFVTRLDEKLLTSWEVMKLSWVVNVGSTFVCCDICFAEQGTQVQNYLHTFMEEYGLPFRKLVRAGSVQELMSSDFFHGTGP